MLLNMTMAGGQAECSVQPPKIRRTRSSISYAYAKKPKILDAKSQEEMFEQLLMDAQLAAQQRQTRRQLYRPQPQQRTTAVGDDEPLSWRHKLVGDKWIL